MFCGQKGALLCLTGRCRTEVAKAPLQPTDAPRGVPLRAYASLSFHRTPSPQALNDEAPNAPWALTFSYGRALQSTTLKVRHRTRGEASAVQGKHLPYIAMARGLRTCRLEGSRVPLGHVRKRCEGSRAQRQRVVHRQPGVGAWRPGRGRPLSRRSE